MTQAASYDPTISFQEEATALVAGRSTVRPEALDAELENVSTSVNALKANATLIQRDDGELRDGVVKPHTFSVAAMALFNSGYWTPRGAWMTATLYAARDLIETTGGSYLALIAHTSGVFATDRAAGKWQLIAPDVSSVTAGNIVYTPGGTIAAATVQAAVAEAASDAMQKSANGADIVTPATFRDNLSVHSKAELQGMPMSRAAAGGTLDAITGAFTPAIASLATALVLFVEAAGANATTTPTFKADGTAAKTIVKGSNTALAPGDIPGANYLMLLAFDVSLDKYVLLNPYSVASSGAQLFTSGGTFNTPPGKTKARIKGCGGGGGGGGSTAGVGGGGGGGGGHAIIMLEIDIVPNGSYTVVVGAGGAGAAAVNTGGSAGGTSSFGAFASLAGGAGGGSGTGGAGGSAAGIGGQGGNAMQGAGDCLGGTGASSVYGSGGPGGTAPGAGVAGGGYGAGGGGAGSSSGGGNAGGAGAPGFWLVEY
jgi:hypothetical protein